MDRVSSREKSGRKKGSFCKVWSKTGGVHDYILVRHERGVPVLSLTSTSTSLLWKASLRCASGSKSRNCRLSVYRSLHRQQAGRDQLGIFLTEHPAQQFQAQTQQLGLRQQIRTGTPTLLTTRQLFFWNCKITHSGEDKSYLYKERYSIIFRITLEENKSRVTFLCGWRTSVLANRPSPKQGDYTEAVLLSVFVMVLWFLWSEKDIGAHI